MGVYHLLIWWFNATQDDVLKCVNRRVAFNRCVSMQLRKLYRNLIDIIGRRASKQLLIISFVVQYNFESYMELQ